MREPRLLGTWKSDRRRTARDIEARADFKPRHKPTLIGMFGHLVLRYTPTRCHSTFRGTTTAWRYTVVGRNADGVLVIGHGADLDGGDALQHIRFEGKDRYWISLGPFREFFRRIDGPSKTATRTRTRRTNG
jgi:hypothetical protein